MRSDKRVRERLNLVLTEETMQRMDKLVQRSGAESRTEVIRRALAVFDELTEAYQSGARIIIRHESGEEEAIRLIW